MKRLIVLGALFVGGCQSPAYHNDLFTAGTVRSIGANYYEYSGVFPAWISESEKKTQSKLRAEIYCSSINKKFKEANYDAVGYMIILPNQSTLIFQCIR
jgi:hypothetical protein